MIYRTIDLCCGIGGIRRGFELASPDFQNVLSADIDAKARRTYEHLYGEKPFSDVTSKEFLEEVKSLDHRYDVLMAGFPCQTFSSVGLKRGFKDTTRGTIFFSLANIISETTPKAVFLENVRNLVSHDHGKTFRTIIDILEKELNYKVIGVEKWDWRVEDKDSIELRYNPSDFVRNSRNFGLPQNRPRVYIAAFSRDWYGDGVWEIPNTLPEHRAGEPIFKELDDVLEKSVDSKYYLASGNLNTLKRHKERQRARGYGFGYEVLNDPAHPKKVSNTILATGGSGKERNLIYQPKEGVAGTLLPHRKTPLNDEGIRTMTPTEWGRLQGFIDYGFMEDGVDYFSFPEGLSDGIKFKQFGNSVTIPTIEEMAKFMHRYLVQLDNSEWPNRRTL